MISKIVAGVGAAFGLVSGSIYFGRTLAESPKIAVLEEKATAGEKRVDELRADIRQVGEDVKATREAVDGFIASERKAHGHQ